MSIRHIETKAGNISLEIKTIWDSTRGKNMAFRVSYLTWRLARGLAYRGYHAFRKTRLFDLSYESTVRLLAPLNQRLSVLLRNRTYPNSVLHISYMVHIPYDTTRLLRRFGMKADYLAIERGGPVWNEADYVYRRNPVPPLDVLGEFYFFWKIVSRYEVIHSHFGIMLTLSGWEYPLLKKMGRKIVIHHRGCEVRDRQKNMTKNPEVNICEQCDYNGSVCTNPIMLKRVRLARQYGDVFLVTTPDMKDFVPDAVHFPFFLPQIKFSDYAAVAKERNNGDEFKIVHVTGHPGIEGTEEIKKAIQNLMTKGYPINFVFLHLVHHDQVLREIATADLTIGKMKMGYYANAQIESLTLGVPAITYVRPEFMTSELADSGLIFSTLKDLEQTLEYYLTHPDELERKRQIARSSVMLLHGDDRLGGQMVKLYGELIKHA
jgi:hypothetical protein